MIRKLVMTMAAMAAVLTSVAQSWPDIQNSGNYYYGEGTGATKEEAKNAALSDLTRQISTTVVSQISTKGHNNTKTFEATFDSYSNATLTDVQFRDLKDKPLTIGAYVTRASVEKSFDLRAEKAESMVDIAEEALRGGKVDVGLMNLVWAKATLMSLPNPGKYKIGSGKQTLDVYIESLIQNVIRDIDVKATADDGSTVQLAFTYKGKPVSSLDFTFNDGGEQSGICHTKNGIGTMELSAGTSHDNFNIEIEMEYRGQISDPELKVILPAIDRITMANNMLFVKGVPITTSLIAQDPHTIATPASQKSDDQPAAGSTSLAQNTSFIDMESFTTVPDQFLQRPADITDAAPYVDVMEKIISAITTKNYRSAHPLFTPNGLHVWNSLMNYGSAKIVGNPQISYSRMGDKVAARGMQVRFSFGKDTGRNNFVEDVVYYFDESGKIDNITFGLGRTTEDNILCDTRLPEEARLKITEFIENYQTAFAMKDIDFIESIFDDNAWIIVGRKLTNAGIGKLDNSTYALAQDKYDYVQYSKTDYINRLREQMRTKRFINLRFNECKVQQSTANEKVFGIEIEQDYFSSNYCDHGYLFLMINFQDPENPLIKVRTWQPDADPNFGTYNLSMFSEYVIKKNSGF